MTSLFDMLGVDKTAGITTDEIEAIKNLLEKIKVKAAQVAETNDADETKKILSAYYTFLGLFVGKSATEIEAAFGNIQAALSSKSTPRVLGAGAAGDAGDADSDLQDKLDAALADNVGLVKDRKALDAALAELGINRLMADAHYDDTNALVAKVKAEIAKTKADAKASVLPTDSVKKSDVKAEVEAIELLIADEKLDDRHLAVVKTKTVVEFVAKVKALVAKNK